MSFPNHMTGQARVALGRKWGLASAESRNRQRLARGIDWHTQRMRAAHDAKGQVLREGTSYRYGRTTNWQIVRSVFGRVNQFDLVINGRVWRTGSIRSAQSAVRYGRWAA